MLRKAVITDQEEISLKTKSTVIFPEDTRCFDFVYNVECVWSNGIYQTFSGHLVNMGSGYFFFKGKDGGIFKVSQNRVIMMMPVGKVKDDAMYNKEE